MAQIYRTGWYSGVGVRQVAGPIERDGLAQNITDVDTHARPALLQHHRVCLSVGQDEYWWPMRDHVEEALARGMHLVFLGADVCYWQIRFEPDGSGAANRTIVACKEAAADRDPLATDRDPRNDRILTGRWRDRPTSRPEDRLVGVMYAADPVDAAVVVDRGDHWAFAGTGLRTGAALPGLLGYEADALYPDPPSHLTRLAHSPFADHGRTRFSDMTIYTAASGALVFATGSMQWNWGLDDYNVPLWHPARASGAAQRVTRNVLDRMLQTTTEPRSRDPRRPSVVVMLAALVAAAAVLRAWIKRPRGAEMR